MFARLTGDNVFNSENDFSDIFQFSIYGPEDTSDWCYADGMTVALLKHNGGDPRGNYGRCRLYRCDSLVDAGFLDWTLGWNVEQSDIVLDGEQSDILDDIEEWEESHLAQLEASEWTTDERLTERCSPGYASCPRSELPESKKSDRCYWFNGAAYVVSDGVVYRCTPYHYHAKVNTPENGLGYTCDAEIDTDDFLEKVLGEELTEVPEAVSEGWDVHEDRIIEFLEREAFGECEDEDNDSEDEDDNEDE